MHSSKSHNLRGKIKFVNKKLTWAWFYIYIIVQKGLYNLPERRVVYKWVLVFFIVFSMQLNINARKERISILKKKNNYRTSKICFELYIFTTSSRTKTMKYIYMAYITLFIRIPFLGQMSHSNDPLRLVVVRRCPSCVNISAFESVWPFFIQFGMEYILGKGTCGFHESYTIGT